MSAQKGKVLIGMGVLLACALFATGCKRKPTAPPTVARAPRVPGPSSEEMAREARAKLMAELEPVPALTGGKTDVAADGEVWTLYDNGMKLHVLRPGDGGLKPKLGQTVSLAYTGYFPDSQKIFERRSKDEPLTFKLGTKALIKGFNIGVSTMHVGEKTRVFLPSNLAYGPEGRIKAGIEPNMPLEFELELLSITGDSVGFMLEDLPKFEPAGPPAPGNPAATVGAATTQR